MTPCDARGNPSGSGEPAARAAVEQALWRMLSFYDAPLADLDAASAADPGWALPHAMRAGFLLSLTEPGLLDEAAGALAQAEALQTARRETPAGERAHLAALRLVLEGRWHAAVRVWDEHLVEQPRDALALLWVHLWDFYRGDAWGLRQRAARALPEWDTADPLFPHVLALWAFGLEESNLYPQAEEAGRRALAADPRVPWAVHAVAHVMEMQGRFEEGAAWLRHHQPAWGSGNGFAVHLWWHKALFRLEAMDTAGALRLVDNHLSGEVLAITLNRVDAAALLWRLHLLEVDVSGAAAALADGWPAIEAHAGHYAFNDVHRVLALLAAGRAAAAEAWVARCAERAMAAEDAGRANHAVAREVGLPLMRGLLALHRGQPAAACELIAPLRGSARQVGGSHAQRDLIDQTLLAAAAAAGQRALGRALIHERTMAKPVTPLTRHWTERLDLPPRARA